MKRSGEEEEGGRPPAAAQAVIPLGLLFLVFVRIGLSGFGGAMPVLRHELVEARRWLTPEAFVEIVGHGNIIPGPNVFNMAVFFGMRARGLPGAAAAALGLVGPPTAVVLGLAELYAQVSDLAVARDAIGAVAAAAAGLILAMAVRMARTLSGLRAIATAAAVFAAMAFLGAPLVWIVVLGAPLSVALVRALDR